MHYPPRPQRPQAYRPRVAGLRQYVVQANTGKTVGFRPLLARCSEPQRAPTRRRA